MTPTSHIDPNEAPEGDSADAPPIATPPVPRAPRSTESSTVEEDRVSTARRASTAVSRVAAVVRASGTSIVQRLTARSRRARTLEKTARETLRWARARDPEINAKTRLPTGEGVSLPAVWVAEAYGPGQVESLRRGLKALGWAEHGQAFPDDLGAWVEAARRNASGGSYTATGTIRRPNSRSRQVMFTSTDRLADLPDGVDFAQAALVSAVPSTVVVIMQFTLDEGAARMLEAPLRRDYASKTEPRPPGVGVLDPEDQRQIAADEIRQKLRAACAAWFGEHLPGAFCAASAPLPSCELLVTTATRPFRDAPGGGVDYFTPLGLTRWHAAVASTEWAGVRMAVPVHHDDPPHHLVLAGQRDELFVGEDLGPWGGRADWGLANRFHDFDRTMTLWALYCLTRAFETQLTGLRDALGAIGLGDAVTIARRVREAEQSLAGLRRDLAPFAREFGALAKRRGAFTRGVVEFGPLPPARPNDPPLWEAVRRDVRRRLRRLVETEVELTRLATGLATLSGALSSERLARSNLRLQWAAVLLSVVSTVIGVVSAVIALAALARDP